MGGKNLLLKWAQRLSAFLSFWPFFNRQDARLSYGCQVSTACLSTTALVWCLLVSSRLNRLWMQLLSLVRFLVSIGKLSSGSHNYYLNLGQEDYYLSGGEPPGTWSGAGAEAQGLQDTVSKEVLANLFRGYPPDGTEPWVQNADSASRVPAWDTVCSPPKSVSVLWSQADFHIRKQIEQAHNEAVHKKNQYLEDVVGYCRKGKGGTEHIRAKLIMANFLHGVNRDLDPQLHTHTLILNLGICDDGQIRALDGRLIYKYKMAAGAVYRAELAHQLRQRLGVRIIPKKTWFEIAGVPQALCDHFSKRRQAIVAELGEDRLEIASAAAYAALKTRSPKSLVPPRSQLFESWQQTGREFGFDINQVIPRNRQRSIDPSPDQVKALVKEAIQRISQKRSCFNDAIALTETLAETVKHGIDPDSVRNQVREQLDQWPEEQSWTDLLGRRQYTSLQGNQEQRKLQCYIDTLQRRSAVWDASCLYVNPIIAKYRHPRTAWGCEIDHHLQQFRRALDKKKTQRVNRPLLARHAQTLLSKHDAEWVRALVRNRGALQVVNTNGLSDIHTILKACNEAWDKARLEVWGFSLTRHGAKTLETETGIRTRSFRAYELMRHPTLDYRIKYSVKQIVHQALFGYSFPLKPLQTKNKILVIYDAHQLNYNQLNEVLSAVKQYGGRVLLVGAADLHRENATAFEHLAHRTRRNDRMKTRTDYFERTPQPIQSHSYERERS